MKIRKSILFFILVGCSLGCSKDDRINNSNPYLPNYPVDITLNLNLPQYSQLIYDTNVVYVNIGAAGIRGVFVFNAGGGNYRAYDAACPNQALSTCSTMTINGIKAKCPCDETEYSFFTGLAPGKEYPMKQYRVQQVNATTLKIYN